MHHFWPCLVPRNRIYKLPQWCSYVDLVRAKINPLFDQCIFVYALPMAFVACALRSLLLATCDLSQRTILAYTLYILETVTDYNLMV